MASSDLLELHERVYDYIKSKALSYEGKPSPELLRYHNDQNYYANRHFQPSSRKELVSSICNSQVIYLGDFHTFDQSSKNLQRIIKALLKNKKKFVLALEMVDQSYQDAIDDYLDDQTSEIEFLQQINYNETWNFPWSNYKVLFDLAKQQEFKVIGLNTEGSLLERDMCASSIISNHILDKPQIPILVLYGEFHIVPNKIPQKVLVKLGKHPFRQTIIHQNLDRVYWKLRELKQNSEVVKFSNYEYNLQSSPPWIKYESMAYWYENLWDDPDYNHNENDHSSESKTLSEDTNENFLFLSKEILTTLGQSNLPSDTFENYNLYDHTYFEHIEDKLLELRPTAVINFFKYLFSTNQLFKIPATNDYYCPNYSINRLSYLAGIHLFHLMAKKHSIEPEQIIKNSNNQERFIMFVFQSLFSFLCSKIVNPRRKCDLYLDLVKKREKQICSRTEKKLITMTLDIIDRKSDIETLFKRTQRKTQFEVAKLIGHIFAEYLFKMISVQDDQPADEEQKKRALSYLMHELFDTAFTIENYNFIRNFTLGDGPYQEKRKRFF